MSTADISNHLFDNSIIITIIHCYYNPGYTVFSLIITVFILALIDIKWYVNFMNVTYNDY